MCHTTGLSYQIPCEDDLWHPMTRTWQFASPMTSGGWTGVRPLLRERFNILAPWQCWLKIDENFWKASKCFKQNEVTIDYRIPTGLGLGDCRSAVATLGRHPAAHSFKNEISWMRSILFMMTSVLVAQWFTMIFAYFFPNLWLLILRDEWRRRVWMGTVMSHVDLVVISCGRFAEANIRLGPSKPTRTADRWSAFLLMIWSKPCWNWNFVDFKTWSLRLLYVEFVFSGIDISH